MVYWWKRLIILQVFLFLQAVLSLRNGLIRDLNSMCNPPKPYLQALPWDCSGFVQCIHRFASWSNCPIGLSFDENLQGCRSPPRSGPCRFPEERAKMFCPDMKGLMFPHPKSCAMFYDCSKDMTKMGLGKYENECRYPKLFDKYDLKCKNPDEAYCGNVPIPTQCQYQLECIDLACRYMPDGNSAIRGKLFQPEYMVCDNWLVARRGVCPRGEVFDPIKLVCSADVAASIKIMCTRLTRLRFPVFESCAKSYDCGKENWNPKLPAYQRECPYFQLWNAMTRRCDHHSKVECGGRMEPKAPCDYSVGQCVSGKCIPCAATCVGVPDGTIAFPGDNTQYMQCRSERTVKVSKCSIGKVFYKARCVDPSTVKKDQDSTTTPFQISTATTETTTVAPTTTTTTPATTASTTPVLTTPPSSTAATTEATSTLSMSFTSPGTTSDVCSVSMSTCESVTKVAALEESVARLTKTAGSSHCYPPPEDSSNRIVSLSYHRGETIATYTCPKGETLCGVTGSGTCSGGKWIQPMSTCMQNVWGPLDVPRLVEFSCQLAPWSTVKFYAVFDNGYADGQAILRLQNGQTVKISFILDTNVPSKDFKMKIQDDDSSQANTVSSPILPGDKIHFVIRVGLDNDYIFLNGKMVMKAKVSNPLRNVESLSFTGNLKPTRQEYTPSNIVHFVSGADTLTDIHEMGYNIRDTTHFTFTVKSCSEAMLYFSQTGTNVENEGVSLTLGAKENKESILKQCRTCPPITHDHASLDCETSKPFWVIWLQTGNSKVITVGTGYIVTQESAILTQTTQVDGLEHIFVKSKKNATWTLSHPSLERCGRPGFVPDAVAVFAEHDSPDTVRFKCLEDFFFCGESDSMTCGTDDLWSGVDGKCVRGIQRISQMTNQHHFDIKCKMGETSAVSMHVKKGPLDMNFNFMDTKGDRPLTVQRSSSDYTMAAMISGGIVNSSTVVASAMQDGQFYHVVVYNTADSFKIYVDGKLEAEYSHQIPWTRINAVTLENTQVTKFEFTPAVRQPTCQSTSHMPQSTSTTSDRTLGARLKYECTTGRAKFCGTSDTAYCSRDGTWIGLEGKCVTYLWRDAKPLQVEDSYEIPQCLYPKSSPLTIDINVEPYNEPEGLTVTLHHPETGQGVFQLRLFVHTNLVMISPGDVYKDISAIKKDKVLIKLHIHQGNVKFFLHGVVMHTAPISFDHTRFYKLTVEGKGTIVSLRMTGQT